MSKKFPDLRSDEEADAWLQSADLSEYDLSGMKKVRFELARKDASISLRLPAALLATLKANAARANMPTQRLIRMMIEAQLAEAGAQGQRGSRSEKPARLCGLGTARLDTGMSEGGRYGKCRNAEKSERLNVWSWPLMGHPYRVIRRMRYGPSSAWERHDDRGDPSSDTA